MKINFKDNKFGVKHLKGINPTRLILFFMITGWLRVLILVIPAIFLYINTGDLRDNVNQESSINKLNDNIPTLKIEQGD